MKFASWSILIIVKLVWKNLYRLNWLIIIINKMTLLQKSSHYGLQMSQCYKLNWRSWLDEWMMHFYIALYCVWLYTQSDLQSCGGGGLSSTTTSVQHQLGWCNGCHRTTAPVRSPHTSYRWRGERVIESIKWMGVIRRPWLIRASRGNLARTPGLHPYSLREVPCNL